MKGWPKHHSWWFQLSWKVEAPEKLCKNTDAQAKNQWLRTLGRQTQRSWVILMYSQLWRSLIYFLHPMKLEPMLEVEERSQRILEGEKGSQTLTAGALTFCGPCPQVPHETSDPSRRVQHQGHWDMLHRLLPGHCWWGLCSCLSTCLARGQGWEKVADMAPFQSGHELYQTTEEGSGWIRHFWAHALWFCLIFSKDRTGPVSLGAPAASLKSSSCQN